MIEVVRQNNLELSEHTDGQVLRIMAESKTKEAINVLELSIEDLHKKYSTLLPIPEWLTDMLTKKEGGFDISVIRFLNETSYAFMFFVSAYNKLSGVDQTQAFEGPLKEFGNYMSHLIIGSAKDEVAYTDNLKKANSHLFRGAMDCYKQFVIDKKDIFAGNNTLFSKLIEIRANESGMIGTDENGAEKQKLLETYESFCNDIPS